MSASSPAHANEIVNFYATGLGPVQPAAETGASGPANPPSLVATPFSCSVPVLFAGLAPGSVGFYQISLQMPVSGPNPVPVSCTGDVAVAIAFQP